MRAELTFLYCKVLSLIEQEDGQDLLEYAFVVTIIALGAAAGMQSVAAGISQVFTNVGSIITTHTQ